MLTPLEIPGNQSNLKTESRCTAAEPKKGQSAFELTLFSLCSRASANVVRNRRVERRFEGRSQRSQNSGRLRGLLVFGSLFANRLLAGFDGSGQFRLLALDEFLGIIQSI